GGRSQICAAGAVRLSRERGLSQPLSPPECRTELLVSGTYQRQEGRSQERLDGDERHAQRYPEEGSEKIPSLCRVYLAACQGPLPRRGPDAHHRLHPRQYLAP